MNVFVMNFKRDKKSLIDCLDLDSFTVEDSDEMYSLDFLVVARNDGDANQSYSIIEMESVVIYKGQCFVIKKCQEYGKGSITGKKVTAIHITFTIQDDFQYEEITGTKSINECLTHTFKANTQGFKYEVINTNGIINRIEQENFGNANLLALIEKVMTDYDVAVVRDNKTFIFIPNEYFSNKTNNQIRYLYNTDDVSFDIDSYTFKTQIKGFGKRKDPKEGQEVGDYYFEPVTYTSPEADYWGIRIQTPVNDERFTIRANMIQRLKRDLQNYPSITGSVTMKELEFEVKRGDLVRFIYEPLNVDKYIKVVGVIEKPFSNEPPQIELDTSKRTMIDYVAMLVKGGRK